MDPILRKNQAGFRPGRSCAQQIHILRRIMEGYQNYQLPLTITFIDFKKAFESIDREVRFAVLRHYGTPVAVVNTISACTSTPKVQYWEYFWSFWGFYRNPAGWCFSSIPLHYSSWLLYEEGHIISWLWSWNSPSPLKTISGQGIEWPGLRRRHCSGHRPSWPVQHQQQNFFALVFPRQSTWLQIVTTSLHFNSMVTSSTMLLTWNIFASKWHQLQVTSKRI